MTQPGIMREVADFRAFTEVDDGYGGTKLEFATVFSAPCRIRTLKGGEEVMASRLAGTATLVVTIRWQPDAAAMDPSWKVVNGRTGDEYEVTAVTVDERRAFIDVLCKWVRT